MRMLGVLIVVFAPVFVRDSACLERPLEDHEEGDGADEDERDIVRVGELAFECLGQDVYHGVSDNCSAGQRVKHADKVFETAHREALLEAGEQEGGNESDERQAETREEAEAPRLLSGERGFRPGKREKGEESDILAQSSHELINE